MSGACSRCGSSGHDPTTCTEGGGGMGEGEGGGGIMLFGVRLSTEGCFRKSASMNNLSQYEHAAGTTTPDHPNAMDAGYVSDDVVHRSGRGREKKRGTPWTEEEHRLFLIGLQKVGKGDWRGISRNFVRTRTPTQVASHAQKYFLRRSNQSRRRRRSSLFDITTDSQLVGPSTMDEGQLHQEVIMSPPQPNPNLNYNLEQYPIATSCSLSLAPKIIPERGEKNMVENLRLGKEGHKSLPVKPIRPIPIIPIPPSSKMAALDLNSPTSADIDHLPLSLKLPIQEERKATAPLPSPSLQAMSSSGDSIISVA